MHETPRNWDAFALLLIDVQRDFQTEEMQFELPNFETNLSSLLKKSRDEDLEVIHLRARFATDRSDWMARYQLLDKIPCVEGSPGADILPDAVEINGEKVFYKQTFDGFHNPDLETYLRQQGKKFLLLAGLVTSVCVLFTAASAAQRGFLVAVIDDCCGDARAAHEHTLERYPFIFSRSSVAQLFSDYASWTSDLQKLAKAAR